MRRPDGDNTPVALRYEPEHTASLLPGATHSDVPYGGCVLVLAKVVCASGVTFFKVSSNGHEGFVKAAYVEMVVGGRGTKRQR